MPRRQRATDRAAGSRDGCAPETVRRAVLVGLAAFLIAFVVFWIPPAVRHWRDAPPGLDSGAYIDIAVQVARGNGLQENQADPAFVAIQTQGSLDTLPPSSGEPVPSTRRPPLWPLVMAAIFRFWGYSLAAARTSNCVAMAAASGVLAAVLTRRHGLTSAIIFIGLFVIVDERLRANARVLMTEAQATLFVSLSAALLLQFARSGRFWVLTAAGAATGLAILARSVVVLWLPLLAILVFWLAVRFARAGIPRAAGLTAAFTMTVLLVCAPWFVHNIHALQTFMPVGSTGYSLPSGFSDQAWANGGVWSSLGGDFFAGTSSPGDPPIVVMRKRAEFGGQKAKEWILAHPVKSVVLGVKKARVLWMPNPSIEMAYLLFPLLGLIRLRRGPDAFVIGGFLLFNTLSIAATWVWEADRFQVPLLGLLHYVGAVGIRHAFRAKPSPASVDPL